MPISYNWLWKLMIDKKMNKTKLKDVAKISGATIAKLGKEELISMESMLKICNVLCCDIGDVVEIVPSEDVDTLFFAYHLSVMRLHDNRVDRSLLLDWFNNPNAFRDNQTLMEEWRAGQ